MSRDSSRGQAGAGISTADWGLLAVFLTLTVAIPYVYVSSERYFYYWDFANYWSQTRDLAAALREGTRRGARLFVDSFGTDYNKLACLPLVPLVLAFGDSRLVFIVGCALFYVASFSLVVGAIATRLIQARPRAVFWTTAFLALLTPSTWQAALRGYVDVGAAALIALAILLWLIRPGLRRWRDAMLLALLLGASMVFRRHFIYDVMAFLLVLGAYGLIRFLSEAHHGRADATRRLAAYAVRLVGLTLLTLMFSATLVFQILHHNYLALYTGWESPLPDLLSAYGREFGWLFWLLAAVGFATGLRRRLLAPAETSFVVLVGLLSLLLWMLSAKQEGVHFSTHWLWLVPLGLSAFGWSVWFEVKAPLRAPVLAAFLVLFVANAVLMLTSLGDFDSVIRPWFARNSPPLVRRDYDEAARLIGYLRAISAGEKAIYVAASSRGLNESLVEGAEVQLYGRARRILKVVPSPDVDSRDTYPLEGLLAADIVVVATPFQYHLRPERQNVVKVVVDAFTEQWEIASDFKKLPDEFRLEQSDEFRRGQDVRVEVYQRERPTSVETAVRTLGIMRARMGRRPGSQPDWLGLWPGWIRRNRDGNVDIVFLSAEHPSSLLYLGVVPDPVRVSGLLSAESGLPACTGVSLRASTLDVEGQVITASVQERVRPEPASFSISLPGRGASYLHLEVAGAPQPGAGRCAVHVGQVTVAGAVVR